MMIHIRNYFVKEILDCIDQGILLIGIQGKVLAYNKSAETILGKPASHILSHDFWENFQDDFFGFSMRETLQKKEDLSAFDIAFTLPHNPNGELEISAHFMQNPEGDGEGLLVAIRDITEMRHLQLLANRADRMKELGEATAHVAHEIRNPLGGIKGFASLLQQDLNKKPELQQIATHIVEGTDNLNRLVSQILHYARPVHPHLEKTDLISLLHEMKDYVLAEDALQKQKIAIEIHSPVKELFLSLDPTLFKSAILNLLVNATQAMPNGGKITLVVQQKHGRIILTISDTGIGIPEELIKKIFSPFFTTKPDGNGLGLDEVQKIIQAHDGTIDVSSKTGQGTAFTIKLRGKQ